MLVAGCILVFRCVALHYVARFHGCLSSVVVQSGRTCQRECRCLDVPHSWYQLMGMIWRNTLFDFECGRRQLGATFSPRNASMALLPENIEFVGLK